MAKGCEQLSSTQSLFDQLPGMIVCKDTKGTIINANQLFLTAHRLCLSQLGQVDLYDIYSKEQADKVTLIDQKVIREQKAIYSELPVKCDNKVFHYFCVTTPIMAQEKIIGTSSVSLDITEKHNRLNSQITSLHNILFQLPGHVYWKGLDNRYIGCNEAQAKALGLNHSDEIVGLLAHAQMPNDIASELRAADYRLMLDGGSATIEEPGICNNGDRGTFLSKISYC